MDELLTGANGIGCALALLVLSAWLDSTLAPRRARRWCRKHPNDARSAFAARMALAANSDAATRHIHGDQGVPTACSQEAGARSVGEPGYASHGGVNA